ncbi:hypothetical protein DV26_42760 [Amycolatopsis mediterranei]|nr:hypothetical protein DV26_42760 [Amycolatopsis mediterranei]
MARAGQPQPDGGAFAPRGGQHEGDEPGVGVVAERAVQPAGQPVVVDGHRQQRPQRGADLAGQHGRVEALAADVAQHGEGPLALGGDHRVDVVEVAADPLAVTGRAVAAGELDAAELFEGRREQIAHQRVGDGRLQREHPRRRHGRPRPRPRPRREQPGEEFLLVGERRPVAAAEQDQGAGGDAVAGQRRHHDGADRPETLRQHPGRCRVRVEPA